MCVYKTLLASTLTSCLVKAASFSTNINFNEAAFPNTNTDVTGSIQHYNVLNDISGNKLLTLNGDNTDISISTTSLGASTSIEYQTASSGRFTSQHAFIGSPAFDNPGTRISNTIELLFAPHLTVTDFSFDVSSVNTAGVTWEITLFEILDVNGNPINTTPTIDPYLTHTEINGMSGIGTYVLDSRATVLNVGTNDASSGVSNPNENFTVTGDLGYSDFGLTPGTQIGGLRMTTILEDTRGTLDGTSNFSASLIDFDFSGEI